MIATAVNRVIWTAAAGSTALLLASFYFHDIGAPASLLFCTIAVMSAWRPFDGLLVVAALAPLSTILGVSLRIQPSGLRLIEALVLACLTGWAAHRALRRPASPVSPALRWSAAALIAAALASAFVSGAALLAEQGTGAHALQEWFRAYAVSLDPVTFALMFAEGVLLMLAVADVCQGNDDRRQAAVRMMAVGAAAAASFNVLRLVVDGAMRAEHPWREFVDLLLHLRVNVHHGDLNAAGSYFALTWFLAAGYAVRNRIAGGVCLLLISVGLWTTGSRVALGATILVALLLLTMTHGARYRRMLTAALLTAVLLAAAATALRVLPARHVADPALALRIRMGLAAGALAMTADHPVFGVGLGHFYEQSAAYVRVPNYIVRENAHNNFLQVLAELGVTGLWLFLVVVALPLSAARNGPREATWPAVAGITAFLLTCLGGHPLLVAHAAIPFWMAVGVAASWPTAAPRRLLRHVSVALIVLLAVALPVRIAGALRGANMANVTSGLSAWQSSEDGERFRWAGAEATFYVRPSARTLTIPMRHGGQQSDPLEVRIFLDGREANRVTLAGDHGWSTVRLALVQDSDRSWRRIDLRAVVPGTLAPLAGEPSDKGGLVMVGSPRIE